MRKKPDWLYQQSGVIPYMKENGEVKIMLITSKKKKHWIIPKGVIQRPLSDLESARQEAYEEAGIKGTIHKEPVGSYTYFKWGGWCTVSVFLMEITQILDDYPEKTARERKLFGHGEISNLIKNEGLIDIIHQLWNHEKFHY